jgi:hypothetical protein
MNPQKPKKLKKKITPFFHAEFFFAAFICFRANSVPRAARMENFESVQSGPL